MVRHARPVGPGHLPISYVTVYQFRGDESDKSGAKVVGTDRQLPDPVLRQAPWMSGGSEVAAALLLALDGLEEGLEVALAEPE